MSRILAIVRHGKSTWEYGEINDFDRPLKESGIKNTIAIAQKLLEKKYSPSLMVSSPANRALHTALILAREMQYPAENVRINTSLYTETEEEVLDLIKLTDDIYPSLYIFGHNPTFTYLANHFLKHKIENLPTSGVALFEFSTDHWADISRKTLVREVCLFPKNINGD